jgi:hypothetical protein
MLIQSFLGILLLFLIVFFSIQIYIFKKQTNAILSLMVSKSDQVKKLIDASFLKERIQRNYFQSYQLRFNKLNNG